MFTIGGVCIAMDAEDRGTDFGGQAVYDRFRGSRQPDIRVRLRRGVPPRVGERPIFACPPIWALFSHNDMRAFRVFPDEVYPGAERILIFSDRSDKADLFFPGSLSRRMDPLTGPSLELLMVTYLGQVGGVITHSCGITMNGKGILFVGESGAGKSTLARLWNHEENIDVLSDDRIVVRKKGNEFWMYGTPWHGEARFASPRGARIERIFFLKHGPTCSI